MRHSPISSLLSFRRLGIIIFFLALIGGYSLFEARRFLEGPQIVVEFPPEGVYHGDRLIDLRAKTKNISSITVNGREVFVTEDGFLKEQLLLPRGYTILTIAAKDRFGHVTQKRLEIYSIDNG